MSDKGRDFVMDHSPYTGTTYFIHYILGDLENAGHQHRLYTGDKWIARAARTTTRTVERAKARMVADKYLEVLSVATGPGRPAEYRFLFPTTDEMSGVGLSTPDKIDTNTRQNGKTHLFTRTKEQSNGRTFEDFYLTYPRHVGKDQARVAFLKALKRAPIGTLIEGAQRYRDDPNREPEYTKHPATWLNAGCWDDDPLPPRSNGNGNHAPVERPLTWRELEDKAAREMAEAGQ